MTNYTLNRTNYSDLFIESVTPSNLNNCHITRISGTRLLISFEGGNTLYRYRVLLFAVSRTGRGKSLERRVEITSTYAGGNLEELMECSDIVIGIDRQGRNMVGLDARRLQFGGETHNASTFVYLPAFDRLESTSYFIMNNDRQSLLDKEYQIYFRPEFSGAYLSESFFLHSSGLRQTPLISVKDSLADTIEEFTLSGSKEPLSYDQQVELALKKMEIGRAGEAFVVDQERQRLRDAGRLDLADKVDWVSQKFPYLGYDIESFTTTGTPEVIEVKSSSGKLKSFFFTGNELNQAKKLSDKYRIACVSNVFKAATIREIPNPAEKISDGTLALCPVTYKVFL